MIPYEDNRVCGLCTFIPTTNPYEDNCMCVCGLCTSVPTTNPYEDNCVCVDYARLSPQRILMKTIVCVGYERLSPQRSHMKTIVCVGYVCVGRGGALVKSITLNGRGVCPTPALAATQEPWASP